MRTTASSTRGKTAGLLLFGAILLACPLPAETRLPTESPRWSAKLARVVARDFEKPPPAGAVVFAGSSSIERWPALDATFPNATVLNRGIGGSWLSDFANAADPLVLSCRPRTVVLYAGENDLAAGYAPADVLEAFTDFRARLRANAPGARLIFLSLKPSPRRSTLIPQIRETNALIAGECRKDPYCTFVDVFTPMLGSDGDPRPELFTADGLHLNATGYRLWNQLLAPVLEPFRSQTVTTSASTTAHVPLAAARATRAAAQEH